MEIVYSRELGLSAAPEVKTAAVHHLSLQEALALYQRLKGADKTRLLFEGSERSIRYLIDYVGHESLTNGMCGRMVNIMKLRNQGQCCPDTT